MKGFLMPGMLWDVGIRGNQGGRGAITGPQTIQERESLRSKDFEELAENLLWV